MMADTLFWLTIGPCVAAVVLSMAADAFAARSAWASLTGAALLAAAASASLFGGVAMPGTAVPYGFRVGGGASTLAGLALALGALVLIGSQDAKAQPARTLAPLVTLAATGAALICVSQDMGVTLLALETTSVCAYALVALSGTRAASEAALKYFIQGSVATAVFLTGFVILAMITRGDLGYVAVSGAQTLVGPALPVSVAVVLVIAAIAFKAGAAPFHAWVPDAYGSARPDSAAFLAGPVKLGAGVAFAIVVAKAVPVSAEVFSADSVLGDLLPVVVGLSVVSVVIGSLGALGQRFYGRMLGYAGVAQVGYALLAVASLNASAALIHLAVYAIGATGSFIAAAAVRAHDERWDGSIEALRGTAQRDPVLAAALTICMVSLAGVPALAGFWGKFQVLGAGIAAVVALWGSGPSWQAQMYVVAVVSAVAASIVSIAYYGSVVRALYTSKTQESFSQSDESAQTEQDSTPSEARVKNEGDVASSGWTRSHAVVVIVAAILLAAGVGPLVFGLTESIRPFVL